MSDHSTEERLYTTGEVAEACGITVRTVQYYDERELLHPTERSDGGRRLYNEDALARMRTICTLKRLGLPLKAIRGVLASDSSDEVLRCLLAEQTKTLERRIDADRNTLDAVRQTLNELTEPSGTTEGEGEGKDQPCPGRPEENVMQAYPDMEHSMSRFFAERGTRLYQTQRKMLIEGIVLDIVEVVCIYIGVTSGNWWPLAAALPLVVIITAELVSMYHRDARYVCPHCHATFQPALRNFFFATHTPKTRKLICTNCGKKDWCAEVAAPAEELS